MKALFKPICALFDRNLVKPDDYITLNESTPQNYCHRHNPLLKGEGLRQFKAIFSVFFRVKYIYIYIK